MMFQSYWVGVGSVAGSLMIYLLELLVAFIQAYIFATLSAMFIGSSMHAH
jgi:F-type H+-transporting ATPase subunit a